MLKVNNKETRATPLASFWYLYCNLSTYFVPCSIVSIVIFGHVIGGRDNVYILVIYFRTCNWWSGYCLFTGYLHET